MLKKLTLPKSLQDLAIEAFFGANGLEQIQIPEGITTLPEGAFGTVRGTEESRTARIAHKDRQECFSRLPQLRNYRTERRAKTHCSICVSEL